MVFYPAQGGLHNCKQHVTAYKKGDLESVNNEHHIAWYTYS